MQTKQKQTKKKVKFGQRRACMYWLVCCYLLNFDADTIVVTQYFACIFCVVLTGLVFSYKYGCSTTT